MADKNLPDITNPSKMSRNVDIAIQSATGTDTKTLAKSHHITQRQVQRILKDDQCKAILDHTMRVNISHAKGINKQFLTMCYPDKDGKVDRKIQLDAIKQYHKITGIAPSHATSLFIQNIYQDNRQLITSDVESLFGMLSGQAAGGGEDITDAEIVP